MSFFNEAMFSPSRSPTIYSSPISSPTPTVYSSYDDFATKEEVSSGIPDSKLDKGCFSGGDDHRRSVVMIRNGKKSYGAGRSKKEILKNINMTVKEGSIYGLLGASGCGKTTLLSCLVGLRNLDKNPDGKLLVFGGRPGDPDIGIPGRRVGYMPQEYALFGEFTVMETLQYFGRIYGMTHEEVKQQAKFLIKLLDLPTDKSRLIRNFSGGQQRRVSFAASLVHMPELLILDEPTVGVDPMLRQSIWKYLVSLSTGARKTTIMITTHYIEEARQASNVAMMRNGRLLAEAPPDLLLRHYGVPTLEDVFLKLCVADNQSRQSQGTSSNDTESSSKQALDLGKVNKALSKIKHAGSKNSTADFENELVSSKSGFLANVPKLKRKKKLSSITSLTNQEEHGSNSNLDKISNVAEEDKRDSILTGKESENLSDNKTNEELGTSVRKAWETDNLMYLKPLCAIFSFNRLWALIVKNFIKMRRNLSLMLFIFLLPAVQVVFFCLAIGRDPYGLVVALINDEVPYSNISLILKHNPDFVKNISGPEVHPDFMNSSLKWPADTFVDDAYFEKYCTHLHQCNPMEGLEQFSCRFVRALTNLTEGPILKLQLVTHYEDALSLVDDGKAWGVLNISSNFTNALVQRMLASPMSLPPDVIEQSTPEIRMDMSNQQINYVIFRSIMESLDQFSKTLATDCEAFIPNATTNSMPIKIGEPVYGTLVPNFTEFMAPGIILIIVFFLAVALTGETFISEKRDGLLDRSRVAGVQSVEILFGAILTQFLVLVGQALITLVFMFAIFKITVNGPLGMVIFITLLQGCLGMCLGFFLSVCCPNQAAAMQATIGSFYPTLMLSGIIWPIEGMPPFFQAITWYFPCTCAVQAMRDIMSRGWGIEHWSVKLGLLSSSAWILIFMTLSIVAIRIQQAIS